jgi:DegV family protein with EDD domain
MIRIVTDSTAHFIDPDFPRKHTISVIPLTIHFDSKVFKEGVDLSSEDFFKRLDDSNGMPTMHAPSLDSFSAVYSSLAKPGDEIISIHTSGKLSNTLMNAKIASEPFAGRSKVHLIDSLSTSVGLGWLVEKAAHAAEAGSPAEDIVRLVRGFSHQLYVAFFVDTLDYLANANRFSKAQAILGAMLGFKPFLNIEEGDIVPTEKMQSRLQAVERLVEFAAEFSEVERIAILQRSAHINEETKMLLEQLSLSFPQRQIPVLAYRPSLATYLGPSGMGVFVFDRQSDEH